MRNPGRIERSHWICRVEKHVNEMTTIMEVEAMKAEVAGIEKVLESKKKEIARNMKRLSETMERLTKKQRTT